MHSQKTCKQFYNILFSYCCFSCLAVRLLAAKGKTEKGDDTSDMEDEIERAKLLQDSADSASSCEPIMVARAATL